MMEKWDGEALRGRMQFQEANARNYANEHSSRLRRKQGNGSAFERDRSLGEAFAYSSLASTVVTDSPRRLMARLEQLLAAPPAPRTGADPGAWADGFRGVYQDVLEEVKQHLGE